MAFGAAAEAIRHDVMSLRVQMSVAKYRNDLNRFVTELNADAQLLLKEEMRLLLRDIVRFTPPKSLAQGRKAIEGDLRRNAKPLDPQKIDMPRLAAVVKKRDIPAILAITKNMRGGAWGGRTMLAGVDQIRAAHLRNRTAYGRVRGDRRNMAFLSDWRKYTKEVQDRVGWTKAGWWRAAYGVGLPLPSWVNKHKAYAPSGYIPPSKGALSITATNRSVKIPNYEERHVFPAIQARAKSLASELRRLLAGGKSRRASLAGTALGSGE